MLVSPFRRAVQTAIIAGSGTGKKMKLTLLAGLREKTTFKNTVASSLSEIKLFVADVMQSQGITEDQIEIDYSRIEDEDLWYLQTIHNEDDRREITQIARNALDKGMIEPEQKSTIAFEAVTKHLREKSSKIDVHSDYTNENIDQFQERLHRHDGVKDELQKIIPDLVKDGGKVLCVTHS